jgi:DNA-binding MarR family transcriptional regulator
MSTDRPEEELKQDAETLADLVMTAQRRFMFRLSKELDRGKVSFAQFFLLGHMTEQKDLMMTAIASRMGHTTAAATGLIDRLEGLGYVKRSTDAKDRRKVLVKITKKGLALVAKIRQDMVENLVKIMGDLTLDEQKAWLSIYGKVNQYCDATPDFSE